MKKSFVKLLSLCLLMATFFSLTSVMQTSFGASVVYSNVSVRTTTIIRAIRLNGPSTLVEGESVALTPSFTTSRVTTSASSGGSNVYRVTWRSSNSSVLTVTSTGRITAVKAGTATITCQSTNSSARASMTIRVTSKRVPIKVTPSNVLLQNGKSIQLQISPISGTTTINREQVNWSSSNLNVASVSKAGKVTALSNGTAIITANYNGYSAKCNVTVNGPITDQTINLSILKDGKEYVRYVKPSNGQVTPYIYGGSQSMLADPNEVITVNAFVTKDTLKYIEWSWNGDAPERSSRASTKILVPMPKNNSIVNVLSLTLVTGSGYNFTRTIKITTNKNLEIVSLKTSINGIVYTQDYLYAGSQSSLTSRASVNVNEGVNVRIYASSQGGSINRISYAWNNNTPIITGFGNLARSAELITPVPTFANSNASHILHITLTTNSGNVIARDLLVTKKINSNITVSYYKDDVLYLRESSRTYAVSQKTLQVKEGDNIHVVVDFGDANWSSIMHSIEGTSYYSMAPMGTKAITVKEFDVKIPAPSMFSSKNGSLSVEAKSSSNTFKSKLAFVRTDLEENPFSINISAGNTRSYYDLHKGNIYSNIKEFTLEAGQKIDATIICSEKPNFNSYNYSIEGYDGASSKDKDISASKFEVVSYTIPDDMPVGKYNFTLNLISKQGKFYFISQPFEVVEKGSPAYAEIEMYGQYNSYGRDLKVRVDTDRENGLIYNQNILNTDSGLTLEIKTTNREFIRRICMYVDGELFLSRYYNLNTQKEVHPISAKALLSIYRAGAHKVKLVLETQNGERISKTVDLMFANAVETPNKVNIVDHVNGGTAAFVVFVGSKQNYTVYDEDPRSIKDAISCKGRVMVYEELSYMEPYQFDFPVIVPKSTLKTSYISDNYEMKTAGSYSSNDGYTVVRVELDDTKDVVAFKSAEIVKNETWQPGDFVIDDTKAKVMYIVKSGITTSPIGEEPIVSLSGEEPITSPSGEIMPASPSGEYVPVNPEKPEVTSNLIRPGASLTINGAWAGNSKAYGETITTRAKRGTRANLQMIYDNTNVATIEIISGATDVKLPISTYKAGDINLIINTSDRTNKNFKISFRYYDENGNPFVDSNGMIITDLIADITIDD